MDIQLVWTLKVAPKDENETLHELGLSWYRFEQKRENFEFSLQKKIRPAVWIQFSQIEQLERIQGVYPDAALGPASSFTEALLFAENQETGETLKKKVTQLLQMENEIDEMDALLREDTMEDY
ncbi:MAG: hypothetical protein HY200_01455 [Nitrospirae bacterium]|nr:hypothetical protein [Nitrospirota bacterium]